MPDGQGEHGRNECIEIDAESRSGRNSVHRQTDEQTDRQTDQMKAVHLTFNFVKAQGMIIFNQENAYKNVGHFVQESTC